MINPFFKNTGPHNISFLLDTINLKNDNSLDDKITDIKDLSSSKKNEITFLHSKKYTHSAKKTKASYCLTSKNFQSFLPDSCRAIITDTVLLHTAQITKIFYPDSITDDYDITAKDISETEFKNKIKFGKNVLIGENVKIGANCLVGHNSIIEKNVNIGDNCSIGSKMMFIF